jgi:hypothetical protein
MKYQERTRVSAMLIWFGIGDIIGGLVMCVQSWPGTPASGYHWLFIAYVPALTWLSLGIVSGVLFFAIAAIVNYLAGIRTESQNVVWLLTHADSAMWQTCRRMQESIGQEEKK